MSMISCTKAIRCPSASDTMRVVRNSNGMIQYFRYGTAEHEEYSYRRPFILELELTRRCNLKCVHCYAEAEDHWFKDELNFEEINCILDQAVEIGIPEISLTGGEVFLHPRFLEASSGEHIPHAGHHVEDVFYPA